MSLIIKENQKVYQYTKAYIITKLVDYNYVLAKDLTTQEVTKLKISELTSKPIEHEKTNTIDLSQIPNSKLEEAKKRLEAISPILNLNSRKAVEYRAKELGVSPTTLYNWIRAYESTGQLSSLAFLAVRGGKDQSRLSKEQDEIIDLVFNEFYLTRIHPTIQKVWEEIIIRCKRANLKAPSLSSIRRRVQKLSEKEVLKRRDGKKAIEKFEIIKNQYPDGLYPMHVLQIDHTKADVILVDDTYRTELGRPWITVAIDIYSRMIAGFYISFEAPGFFGTGQTIVNAILPKDHLKEKFKFKSDWPICGIPKIIHMDNAREFKGTDLQNICEEYNIDIVWRPVGKSWFGGHIERLLGSLTKYIHTLEGTTFEKVNKNREYNAGKQAVMTLYEFEEWLTILIADVYHKKIHSQIKMTPLQKFDEGVFGTDTQPPSGLPPRIENEDDLKINLLPKEERTIQRYGIQIDNIFYYSEVLNAWIDSYENIRGKKLKKKFIVRRDYRDISYIWFYEPTVKTYYKIPYRNPSLPIVSIWEYRAAQKYLKSIENREYNEDEVFTALERLKTIAKESKSKTKTHRKLIDREKKQQQAKEDIFLLKQEPLYKDFKEVICDEDDNYGWFDGKITPFDGIEESSQNKMESKHSENNKNDCIDNEVEVPF